MEIDDRVRLNPVYVSGLYDGPLTVKKAFARLINIVLVIYFFVATSATWVVGLFAIVSRDFLWGGIFMILAVLIFILVMVIMDRMNSSLYKVNEQVREAFDDSR